MQFFLNGVLTKVDDLDPNTSLLRYLRTRAKLKGTKEGCGSGDCGACTLLVGQAVETQGKTRIRFRSVNACIALLASVHNRYVITVEGLAKDKLHPAQQAMLDCHGSQCGFCTPGFVMSLAGLYDRQKQNTESNEDTGSALSEAISGNLCRCTGDRPILQAGQEMLNHDYPGLVSESELNQYLEMLSGPTESLASLIEQQDRKIYQPADETELQRLILEHQDAELLCGGTDLVLGITQNFKQHSCLIDVSRVTELLGTSEDEDHLYIGASTPYIDLWPSFSEKSPDFLKLLHRLGSQQIRNRGSIGGNIANGSPIADTPPVLLAWDAEVERVTAAGGKRDWIAISDLYLDYKKTLIGAGQYIARIRIPLQSMQHPHRFYKVSKRFEDDISSVMAAISVRFDELEPDRIADIRIAFGGMAAIPKRALAAESALRGSRIATDDMEAALQTCSAAIAEEFKPMTDVRASAAYRLQLAQNLIRRLVDELGSKQSLDVFSVGAVKHYQPGNLEQGGQTNA